MKKMYKKPQTEKVALATEIRCQEIGVGSGGNSTDGKWGGKAPARQV